MDRATLDPFRAIVGVSWQGQRSARGSRVVHGASVRPFAFHGGVPCNIRAAGVNRRQERAVLRQQDHSVEC